MSTVRSPVTALTHLLSDGWTVRPAEPVPQLPLLATVPATVPGCVHTDLLAAGLIRQDSRRLALPIFASDPLSSVAHATWNGSARPGSCPRSLDLPEQVWINQPYLEPQAAQLPPASIP